MPPSWGHNARDLTHIKSIHKWATGEEMKNIPTCSLWKWNYYRWIKKIKTFYILDYSNYNREESIKMLEERFGFQDYGLKHEENFFTSWFQNFYLFEKFGIDKRKAHFSSMILSGQMTREKAIEELGNSPVYPGLGIEKQAMSAPKRKHEDFPVDKWYERIAKVVKYVSP